MKNFLRDNWPYIVVPLVVVLGGLLLLVLSGDEGWEFNYKIF